MDVFQLLLKRNRPVLESNFQCKNIVDAMVTSTSVTTNTEKEVENKILEHIQ